MKRQKIKRGASQTYDTPPCNRCALRLAGHQSPRQSGCAGWDRLAESLAESGGIRALARIVLAGMNPQGEDLQKLLGGMGPPC